MAAAEPEKPRQARLLFFLGAGGWGGKVLGFRV